MRNFLIMFESRFAIAKEHEAALTIKYSPLYGRFCDCGILTKIVDQHFELIKFVNDNNGWWLVDHDHTRI